MGIEEINAHIRKADQQAARKLAKRMRKEIDPVGYVVTNMDEYVEYYEMRDGIAYKVKKRIVAVRGLNRDTGEMVTVPYHDGCSEMIPLGVKAIYPVLEGDESAKHLAK